MIKKTITFVDPFTEEEKTQDFYFHISKADLIEMEMSQSGGMQDHLERVIGSNDGAAIMVEFKKILKLSYGKKIGDSFVKTKEAWDEFSSGEAYSNLFFELCTNAEKAVEFIQGIIPRDISAEAAKVAAQASQGGSAGPHPSDTAAQPASVAETTPVPAQDKVSAALGADTTKDPRGVDLDRSRVIATATSENPVTLTSEEVAAMDSDELKSGLATGRYKLA